MRPEYLHQLEGSPYAREINATLPRVLALVDRDPLSRTRGIADREFWAWKLIDFPNATFQGAVNGFAGLLKSNLLTEPARSSMSGRIEELVHGARTITRRDGSLEESFPFERSYCVTALIAYDLLHARENLCDGPFCGSTAQIPETVAPMIRFLVRSDEKHGLISNHLATASAALFRWHRLAGDLPAHRKAVELLDRIISHQGEEGWFSEYGGADPGYQTLCLTYLADILRHDGSARLTECVTRAMRFLWHFAHPDGSFGGVYGSRNTRIFYPAGVEALRATLPEAAVLADFMRSSIGHHRTVPLTAIDDRNLMPVFNNYCWSACLLAEAGAGARKPDAGTVLPALSTEPLRRHFKTAGLIVDGGKIHYTIVSSHKGGVVYHFRKGGATSLLIDSGIAAQDGNELLYSNQALDPDNEVRLDPIANTLTVVSSMRRVRQLLPGPLLFLVLRCLNVSVMGVPSISEAIKKLLVRLLITGQAKAIGRNRRTIALGPELSISDQTEGPEDLRRIAVSQPFSIVHMASRGYWQAGDLCVDERRSSWPADERAER